MGCYNLVGYSCKHYNLKNISYVTLLRMKQLGQKTTPTSWSWSSNVLYLLLQTLNWSKDFLFMRRIETGYRSSFSEISLSAIVRIAIDGLPCKDMSQLKFQIKFFK